MYYEIDEGVKDIFVADTYLFREKETDDGARISVIFVDKIIDRIQDYGAVQKIVGELKFRKVNEALVFQLEENAIREYNDADLKQFKRLLKQTISDLQFHIGRRYCLSDERRKYLIDTYFNKPEEFENNSIRDRHKWIQEVNGKELDLYYGINIRELKRIIESLVEGNNSINNIDKLALKSYCIDELDYVFGAIGPKGNARMQMDDYIGVHVDYKKKDLIWGYRTYYPIRVGFSFFWGLIKNMLSLAYVPAIILLLDNTYKIPIYIMLSIVYLITLFFSDENQLDKLLCGINKHKEGISYRTLYYYGLMLSITFILFSVEMVICPSDDVYIIVQYLLADIVGAYSSIILFNIVISLFSWIVTLFSTTRFYRKGWKKIRNIMLKVVVTTIYILGVFSFVKLFDIKKYLINNNVEAEWICWIFFVICFTGLLRIVAIWSDMFKNNKC